MDPAIRLLRDLVAIDSVNPTLVPGAAGEAVVAGAIADEMRAIGLEVQVEDVTPGRPNVVGILEGAAKGRTLMFCGHTDTVGVAGMDAPFSPIEKNGRLYGRGAQDMKGGVAAMISAARVIAGRGGLKRGRLLIAAVVDEEHSSIGAEALVKKWRADAAVVTEPTDLTIATGHKGFSWVEIEVSGKAAHGSRPLEGEDAILRLGRVLTQLERLDRQLQARRPHPLVGTGSLHASIVSGGRELSSYPDRALLQMERRTLPGDAETVAIDEVREILEELRRSDPTFNAEARSMFSRPAYEIASGHQLPQLMAAAVAKAGGVARTGGASFWADAAILGHAGIPSVLFGPGGRGCIRSRSTSTSPTCFSAGTHWPCWRRCTADLGGRRSSTSSGRAPSAKSRDAPFADELRSGDHRAAALGARRDFRLRIVEVPAARFVTARHTLQRHPFALKLKHFVVSAQAAARLPHPAEHPVARFSRGLHFQLLKARSLPPTP